jgi:ferredoxin
MMMRRRHIRNEGRHRGRQESVILAYGQPSVESSLWGGEDELNVLRRRVQVLRQRVERIKQKMGEPEPITNQKTSAIVDEEECAGCGLCYEVCPTGAISVNGIAQIDSNKCIACLACVNRCPQGAIAVKYGNRQGNSLSTFGR